MPTRKPKIKIGFTRGNYWAPCPRCPNFTISRDTVPKLKSAMTAHGSSFAHGWDSIRWKV